MRKLRNIVSVICIFIFIISGCTAMTNIKSTQPGVTLKVTDKSYSTLPAKDEFGVTTFGNYEFVAKKDGHEPLYGVLPLKINGGYLALDILFFAPACFFNLREVYPYYDIDVEKKMIRYSTDNNIWYDLFVTQEETEQAKKYYEDLKGKKEEGKK